MLQYITTLRSVLHSYCLTELILTLYHITWRSVGAAYVTAAMHRGVWTRQNTIPSGVLHDVVQRLYQGILYFQNVMCFKGTCVNLISFMPVIRVWPSLQWLIKNSQIHDSSLSRAIVPNFTQIWQWKIWIWINSGLQMDYSIRCTNLEYSICCTNLDYSIHCTDLDSLH